MDARLAKIYYSPQGYWKGIATVKKLANAAKVTPEIAKQWLVKQALWQVYLPPPRNITFNLHVLHVFSPNAVHRADFLFLPHDTYKYALTVVDVASRYKAAEALTSKSLLKWRKPLTEFTGRVV